MESQTQNPEFRNNPENFHPCMMYEASTCSIKALLEQTVPSTIFQLNRPLTGTGLSGLNQY